MRQYLSSKGFNWTEKQRSNGLEAIMNCPFCNDREKKFAINLDNGAYNCFHSNNCGANGSFYQFQKNLGDKPISLDSDFMLKKKKSAKVYKKPQIIHNALSTNCLKFFEGRKITEDTLKFFKIRETPDGKAIIFPYLKNKTLVGVKYRSIAEKKFWKEAEAEPTLFNIDNVSGEILILMEGECDVLAMKEYGLDAVSIPSGVNDLTWIEHEWEYLQQFKSIYLIMDYDLAGRTAVDAISKRLGQWRCYNVILPYKDVNECLMQGVPVDIILSAMDNAKDCRVEYLQTAYEFVDEVKTLFHDDNKLKGKTTGFHGLDNIIRGWRECELTVWTGSNGSGKSTFLSQVCLSLASIREKSCVASLEMNPARYLRWTILQCNRGKFINDKKIEETLTLLDNCIYIVNNENEMSVEDLLNVWEYATRKYGVKHFILDSLMRIKMDYRNELDEQKRVVSSLVGFAKTYRTHVHLVAHPRKGSSDADKPDKVDVSGTAHITNLAHNVLVLWRPPNETKEDNDPDNILYVKKNREWGEEGKVRFSFDAEYKYFTEV